MAATIEERVRVSLGRMLSYRSRKWTTPLTETAGVHENGNIPSPILPEKFCAIGSGQNFSYGVLEAKYKENLTIAEGKEIVIKAVTSSIIRDMASGNGIDIAIVKKQGSAERDFIPIKD